MTRIKLSFVSQAFEGGRHNESPLFNSIACYQLASFLRSDPAIDSAYEISVRIFDPTTFWGEGWPAVLTAGVRIVACSLYVWNVEPLHAFVQALKEADPDIIAIAGGPEVFDRADFAATFPAFDVLVEGDGELPLRDVLLRLREGDHDLSEIGNVSFRADGQWVHNRRARAATDPDLIPEFLSENKDLIYGRGFYLSVRGCPHGCAYCLWARQATCSHHRERVLRDLDTLLTARQLSWLTLFDYDIVEVYRNDPELFEILGRAQSKLADGRQLSFFTAPQNLTDPAIGALFERLEIGSIVIGVQSANPDALAAVSRRWAAAPLELFDQVPRHLRSRFRVELIFPLPGETADTFLDTVRRLLALGYPRLRIFNLLVFRGTTLHRRRAELGLKCLPRPPYLCFETKQVPRAEFLRLSALGRALTLLGSVADGRKPEEALLLMQYCQAHLELVDRMLDAITAGQPVEAIVAAIVREIPGFTMQDRAGFGDYSMATVSRLAYPLPEEPAESDDTVELPHLERFVEFFADHSIALQSSRRQDGGVVLDLSSAQGSWSILVVPRGSDAPSFRSTRFYDISYSGKSAVPAIAAEFAGLIRTLESGTA